MCARMRNKYFLMVLEVNYHNFHPLCPGHGSELPYVFHNAELGGFKYTSDERAMADALVTYWTTFARTGNPNPFVPQPPVPDWPAYRQNYTSTVFAAMKFKTPKSEVCWEDRAILVVST